MDWLYLVYAIAGGGVGFSLACVWFGYREYKHKCNEVERYRFTPVAVGDDRMVIGDMEYDLHEGQY